MQAEAACKAFEKDTMRDLLTTNGIRPDGRALDQVRLNKFCCRHECSEVLPEDSRLKLAFVVQCGLGRHACVVFASLALLPLLLMLPMLHQAVRPAAWRALAASP